MSGIIGNEWYDRADARLVTSVTDASTKLLGGPAGAGSSPRRFLADTVGDELKMADGGKSRVIGISLKDRAAILPAGHMANGAFWLDSSTGHFVSSTYYFEDVPGWVKNFNDAHPADGYARAKWLDHTMPADLAKLYPGLAASPFGNEMVESFAERALESEQLGMHEETDILTVSFSSNDYIGHAYGPDSPEVREISIRSDALLGKLLQAVDRQVGLDRVLVVMTADHGVAPVPEVNAARHMPGGRIVLQAVADTVQKALRAKYGDFDWITNTEDHSVYLNWELIAAKKLDLAEVTRTAAQAVAGIPHVARVFTREQLIERRGIAGPIRTRRVERLLCAARGRHRIPAGTVLDRRNFQSISQQHVRLRYACAGGVPGRGNPRGALRRIDRGQRYRAHAGQYSACGDAQRVSGPGALGDVPITGKYRHGRLVSGCLRFPRMRSARNSPPR